MPPWPMPWPKRRTPNCAAAPRGRGPRRRRPQPRPRRTAERAGRRVGGQPGRVCRGGGPVPHPSTGLARAQRGRRRPAGAFFPPAAGKPPSRSIPPVRSSEPRHAIRSSFSAVRAAAVGASATLTAVPAQGRRPDREPGSRHPHPHRRGPGDAGRDHAGLGQGPAPVLGPGPLSFLCFRGLPPGRRGFAVSAPSDLATPRRSSPATSSAWCLSRFSARPSRAGICPDPTGWGSRRSRRRPFSWPARARPHPAAGHGARRRRCAVRDRTRRRAPGAAGCSCRAGG